MIFLVVLIHNLSRNSYYISCTVITHLTVTVIAPCPWSTVCLNCRRIIISCINLFNILNINCYWNSSCCCACLSSVSLKNIFVCSFTQLTSAVIAPCPYTAILIKSKHMVCTCRDRYDIFKIHCCTLALTCKNSLRIFLNIICLTYSKQARCIITEHPYTTLVIKSCCKVVAGCYINNVCQILCIFCFRS